MPPMIGRMSRPGMIHSDATEKPIDRARGGIASAERGEDPGREDRAERP